MPGLSRRQARTAAPFSAAIAPVRRPRGAAVVRRRGAGGRRRRLAHVPGLGHLHVAVMTGNP